MPERRRGPAAGRLGGPLRGRRPARRDEPARALVAALRAELAAVDPPRACDRAAERAGLGPAATGEAPDAVVARLAVRLERDTPSGGSVGAAGLPGTAPPFVWATAADHCRAAWLRGRFLDRGSLSLSGGRTHLEFVVPLGEAPELAERLAAMGLPAGWRERRGDGVVTWKSSPAVLRFLRLAGGSAAVLELEARLVARSLQASLNRVANAEAANLVRSVRASRRQLWAIAALEADGRLERQDPVLVAVARARQEAPEASLGDLAAAVEVSRAAVQRSFERIAALAGSVPPSTPAPLPPSTSASVPVSVPASMSPSASPRARMP